MVSASALTGPYRQLTQLASDIHPFPEFRRDLKVDQTAEIPLSINVSTDELPDP